MMTTRHPSPPLLDPVLPLPLLPTAASPTIRSSARPLFAAPLAAAAIREQQAAEVDAKADLPFDDDCRSCEFLRRQVQSLEDMLQTANARVEADKAELAELRDLKGAYVRQSDLYVEKQRQWLEDKVQSAQLTRDNERLKDELRDIAHQNNRLAQQLNPVVLDSEDEPLVQPSPPSSRPPPPARRIPKRPAKVLAVAIPRPSSPQLNPTATSSPASSPTGKTGSPLAPPNLDALLRRLDAATVLALTYSQHMDFSVKGEKGSGHGRGLKSLMVSIEKPLVQVILKAFSTDSKVRFAPYDADFGTRKAKPAEIQDALISQLPANTFAVMVAEPITKLPELNSPEGVAEHHTCCERARQYWQRHHPNEALQKSDGQTP